MYRNGPRDSSKKRILNSEVERHFQKQPPGKMTGPSSVVYNAHEHGKQRENVTQFIVYILPVTHTTCRNTTKGSHL